MNLNLIVTRLNSKSFKSALYSTLPVDYTFTNDLIGQVFREVEFQFLRLNVREIEIISFKSANPWSKSIGYVLRGTTDKIYINTRKKLSEDELAGFLAHELSHIAGYGHGSNSVRWWNRKKKEASAPCRVGIDVKKVYRSLYL